MTSRYAEVYAEWRADPQAFWAKAALEIDWIRKPERIFDPEAGVYGRWFPGCDLQHLFQCARPPCRRRDAREQAAILYDSPVTGVKKRISYGRIARRSRNARRRARRISESARATG